MKPCWCKTITNLLLCINFHSNDCLWSSYEGPVTRFTAKHETYYPSPLNEWCWNLQALHFLQVGKRKGLQARNTRVFTPIRDQCSYVNMLIEILFISFSATLGKAERHFYSYLKDLYILKWSPSYI